MGTKRSVLVVVAATVMAVPVFVMAGSPGLPPLVDSADRFERHGREAVEDVLASLEADNDCDAALESLNILFVAKIPDAIEAWHQLDTEGRCGDLEDVNLSSADHLRQGIEYWAHPPDLGMTPYHRLWRTAPVTPGHEYWQTVYGDYPCVQLALSHTIHSPHVLAAYRRGDVTTAEAASAMRLREMWECRERHYRLGLLAQDSDDEFRRSTTWFYMRNAANRGHPEAGWWIERVFPDLDEERFSDALSEVEPPDGRIDCAAAQGVDIDRLDEREWLRNLAGSGHALATDEWLDRGVPHALPALQTCLQESGVDQAAAHAWRGGYDTPFWFAVHAARIEYEIFPSDRQALDAALSSECRDMAVAIGEGLRPILPGPPVNDPHLLALIRASRECQPDGLRGAKTYLDDDQTGVGFFDPPEIAIVPPHGPMLGRASDEASNTDQSTR